MPDVEESFNVTRPVSPHEVSFMSNIKLMKILLLFYSHIHKVDFCGEIHNFSLF